MKKRIEITNEEIYLNKHVRLLFSKMKDIKDVEELEIPRRLRTRLRKYFKNELKVKI